MIGIHTDKFGFKHVWEIWSVSVSWRDFVTELRRHQALPGVLWLDGLSLVCVQPDNDQRSLSYAANVHDHCIHIFVC